MEWVNWQYKDYLDNRYANSVVFDTGKVNPKMITEKILEDIK